VGWPPLSLISAPGALGGWSPLSLLSALGAQEGPGPRSCPIPLLVPCAAKTRAGVRACRYARHPYRPNAWRPRPHSPQAGGDPMAPASPQPFTPRGYVCRRLHNGPPYRTARLTGPWHRVIHVGMPLTSWPSLSLGAVLHQCLFRCLSRSAMDLTAWIDASGSRCCQKSSARATTVDRGVTGFRVQFDLGRP